MTDKEVWKLFADAIDLFLEYRRNGADVLTAKAKALAEVQDALNASPVSLQEEIDRA